MCKVLAGARDVSAAEFLAGMASSDSDDYYTEDDEETDYSEDEDDDDDEEGNEDDSEYSLEIDEDDEETEDEDEDEDDDEDDDDDEEEESGEDVAEEYENAEEEVSGSDITDDDDGEEEVPALEHGQQDEISEGPDAPISGFSTPVDPVTDDPPPPAASPSPVDQPKDIIPLKGNPNPVSTATAPPQLDGGSTTVSSLATDLEKAKIESPPAA